MRRCDIVTPLAPSKENNMGLKSCCDTCQCIPGKFLCPSKLTLLLV